MVAGLVRFVSICEQRVARRGGRTRCGVQKRCQKLKILFLRHTTGVRAASNVASPIAINGPALHPERTGPGIDRLCRKLVFLARSGRFYLDLVRATIRKKPPVLDCTVTGEEKSPENDRFLLRLRRKRSKIKLKRSKWLCYRYVLSLKS